ncbi:MAG: hypothetical protein ACRC9Y_02000 [Aeromonas veronii]
MTDTLHQWQAKAREIPASNLRKAVELALWLIADKGKPLGYAVKTAANKHGATQAATKRQVKAIIEPGFFIARRQDSARQLAAGWSEEDHQQRRHQRDMQRDNRHHMAAIAAKDG